MRARGLKLDCILFTFRVELSRPMRARGLKLNMQADKLLTEASRAPCGRVG